MSSSLQTILGLLVGLAVVVVRRWSRTCGPSRPLSMRADLVAARPRRPNGRAGICGTTARPRRDPVHLRVPMSGGNASEHNVSDVHNAILLGTSRIHFRHGSRVVQSPFRPHSSGTLQAGPVLRCRPPKRNAQEAANVRPDARADPRPCSPGASEIVAALRAIVPGEGVIAAEREMRPYESDGLTAYRQLPLVVVLPETTDQVAAGAALLPRQRHQGGAARRRHLAVRRRAAAGRRRAARHGASSTASSRSTTTTAASWREPGVTNLAHQPRRSRTRASTTRPIPRRRSPARSAATSRRIPAACIA